MMQRHILKIRNLQSLQRRFYKKHQVRVRFAPSPTGHLHLGGLRTALYNYLFARANNGHFILRIEDTDQSRVVPGAMEKLEDDLHWAGIITDEGPTRGGPVGPYVQSKRLDLYREQAEKLLENGSAYYCFCTTRRLDMLRKEAMRLQQVPKYDNRCRQYSKDEVEEKLRRRESHCLRFKLSSEINTFNDLIYGPVTYDVTKNEGDPIIIKADGYPTYHFANVVDDHFMEISHVLRGVEWQISTPKHLLLYRAFNWNPPEFAHLPLILNSDGTKLSKRQGDIMVDAFRQDGIFPLALLNYITQAGGGFNREQNDQCYSYEDLIKQFDITKVNVHSSKLNPDKLLQLNRLEIANLLENEKNNKFFVRRVSKLIVEAFPDKANDGTLQLDEGHIISTLKWAKCRISKLSDLVSPNFAFLWTVPPTNAAITEPAYLEAMKVLSKELAKMEATDFTEESLKVSLRNFASTNELSFPSLMKTLRVVLSGLKDGPGVAEMMEILGRDQTLTRLKRCLS